MIIGDRIAALMKAHELSQAEIARRAGVSQPTIFKMIRSNKTGSVHLHKVARALGTTAAYLSGETDDPSIDAAALAISPADLEWIDLLHALSPRNRQAVLVLARTLAGQAPAPLGDGDDLRVPVFQSQRMEFKGAR